MISPRPELDRLADYHPGLSIAGGIKLSSNENPLGSSPRALRAAQEALAGAHRYPDTQHVGLRTALAHRYAVSVDQVIVGNGADELIELAAAISVSPGGVGIVVRHTFSLYEFAVRRFGGDVIRTEMVDGCISPPHILRAIDGRLRILFLCNPNNPTGCYLSASQLGSLCERLPSNLLIVLDEAYADFAEAPDFPDSQLLMRRHPNLLVLRTFSKFYGLAGLRIGFGLAHPTLIASLRRVRQPFSVNVMAQAAATAALRDEPFQRETLRTIGEGKRWLYDQLRRLALPFYPSEANFICFRIPASGLRQSRRAIEVVEELASAGVAVRYLGSFGLDDSIRVSIGTMQHNRRFVEALRSILYPTTDGD